MIPRGRGSAAACPLEAAMTAATARDIVRAEVQNDDLWLPGKIPLARGLIAKRTIVKEREWIDAARRVVAVVANDALARPRDGDEIGPDGARGDGFVGEVMIFGLRRKM